MDKSHYTPKPLDISHVELAEDLTKLTALLAENAHESWAAKTIDQGYKFGAKYDDTQKTNPRLMPFKDLPASKKKRYRETSLETIKSLLALGYRIDAPDGSIVQAADFRLKSQQVVKALKNPKLTIAELRELWEERLPLVWSNDVQVYRRAVDAALKVGESFMAFDMSSEGLLTFADDLRLIQLQALALARTGATRRANAILDRLRSSGHKDEETLGLLARTHKDFWQIATDPKEKQKHLKLSYELYLEAYTRNRGYYSGINAASMGLIYGEKESAQRLAQEVADLCRRSLDQISGESDERYWLEATLAESALILGDFDEAEKYYKRVGAGGLERVVVISRTRTQARLLLEHLGSEIHRLDQCFNLPRIVVFSGHMFDRLDRKVPRFPYTLEPYVREQIEERLSELNAQVGYSSLACGADMIFADALLRRGGEVNIVLPFRKDDFKKASVEIMPGVDWGKGFDEILRKAATVTVLNELGDANDGAAYDFCNQALSGLAILKSQFLGMDVMPLVVWDRLTGDGRGGTQSFVEFWKGKGNGKVDIITVSRQMALASAPVIDHSMLPPPPPVAPPPPGALSNALMKQDIKAMIFADIVGYTKLSEVQIPLFVKHFLGKVAELMDSMSRPPIHKNTWGDAVCAVFDYVGDAGNFALKLRDLVRGTDWRQWGLPNELNIRIGLHAGPVFTCYDPVLKKQTFNGSHVNRTARIEPIAEEGQVYASEAFSALAAAEGVSGFNCDYVGTKQLAKKYGAIPVFLVRPTV